MFNEFKNSELFRHQLSSRMDKSLRRYADQSKNSAERIISTIFSACCSLMIAYLTHSYIDKNNPYKALVLFGLFLFVYVVAYCSSRLISTVLETILYNLKHHGSQLTDREIKELVDDFDHIACDNNLIGKLFTKSYIQETDIDIKEYEFYELHYYVNVSSDITLQVLDNSSTCINTLEKVNTVDLHRIYNQLNMLKTAKTFLLNHINDAVCNTPFNLKLVIFSQIIELEKKIASIQKKCNEFSKEHFSDIQVMHLKEKYKDYLQ